MNAAPTPFFSTATLPGATSFLSVIFFAALIAAIVMTFVLLYHWFQYGAHAIKVRPVAFIYGAGVAFFIALMAFSL